MKQALDGPIGLSCGPPDYPVFRHCQGWERDHLANACQRKAGPFKRFVRVVECTYSCDEPHEVDGTCEYEVVEPPGVLDPILRIEHVKPLAPARPAPDGGENEVWNIDCRYAWPNGEVRTYKFYGTKSQAEWYGYDNCWNWDVWRSGDPRPPDGTPTGPYDPYNPGGTGGPGSSGGDGSGNPGNGSGNPGNGSGNPGGSGPGSPPTDVEQQGNWVFNCSGSTCMDGYPCGDSRSGMAYGTMSDCLQIAGQMCPGGGGISCTRVY